MEVTLFALNNATKCGGFTHFLQLKAAAAAERSPIHIIAVIDISGSMQFDDKLENVKKSLKAILEFMNSTDMLSLVTFSKSSDIIAQRTLTTPENKYILSQAISCIDVDCSTNLSSGLISGFECEDDALPERGAVSKYKTSILLLTDGEANEGITNPDSIIDLIHDQSSASVNIYTFGYGTDHNAALLSLIADEKDGAYNVVNSLENVASAIGSAFGSIASCIAQNIVVESEVAAERAAQFYSGFPLTLKGGVRVGDMTAGGETGILVKNPNGLRIKGYSVTNGFTAFTVGEDIIEKKEATSETDKSAFITYMRIKLAEYIEKPPADSVLNEFEAALEGDDEIIKIMRKEVREIKERKNIRFGGMGGNIAIQMQHAHFYRNLRSQYSAPPAPIRDDYYDNNDVDGADDNNDHDELREFSMLSPTVRTIRNNVYTRATRHVIDDNDYTANAAPIRNDPSDNILSIHTAINMNED